VPSIVEGVTPLPIISAGGIATGRTVAAALALGAVGICVGTRLLASHEAYAHDDNKHRIVAATNPCALFGIALFADGLDATPTPRRNLIRQ
jgi:NAD(P)H-dependent flavin oxidoreductase YrpB (nitropropane dioxygenase family)